MGHQEGLHSEAAGKKVKQQHLQELGKKGPAPQSCLATNIEARFKYHAHTCSIESVCVCVSLGDE